MELLASRSTVSMLFVSPRYRFRYARSVRANTFQSTWRRSSPGEYARYSANSWEKPKSGERWRPATNPSTTVLATRSSPEMEASVDGSRKRCSIYFTGRGIRDFTAETQRRRVKKDKTKSENAEGAEVTGATEGSLNWFTSRFKPFVRTGSLKLMRSPP